MDGGLMAIHGSQRWQNVKATTFTHLDGLTVSGAPAWVYEGQARGQAKRGALWCRATLLPVSETLMGLWDSTARALHESLILAIDVFQQDGSAQDQIDTYAIDAAVDDLRFELTALGLPLKDYAADPDAPSTLTGHGIRFTTVTRSDRMRGDGYDRVQLRASAYYFAQHAL